MKLRVYQRLVFLFVLGWCAGTVSLLAQEPVELPEGVAPGSEWAYGKHLEQLEEIMKVSIKWMLSCFSRSWKFPL